MQLELQRQSTPSVKFILYIVTVKSLMAVYNFWAFSITKILGILYSTMLVIHWLPVNEEGSIIGIPGSKFWSSSNKVIHQSIVIFNLMLRLVYYEL